MRFLLAWTALAAALGGCADAQTAAVAQSPAQTEDTVVAEVAGRTITLRELDERWQALDPAERARVTQLLYQNRRNVLEQMIGDVLIEQAATKAGLSVADYLEREAGRRTAPVTDGDIAQFYEENKDRAQGRTLDELREPIRAFLQDQRRQQARARLVGELMDESGGARILLDPPRQAVTVNPDDPVRGPADAPITIIEYSDYQCPFCARVTPTLAELRKTYGDKVRIVFKDFPLPNHPEAPKAAEAAHCAGDQGKYWEMHDRLFANQRALQVPALKQHAASLGLDMEAFSQCLDSGKHAARVEADLREGEALGVNSTPTLFINGRPVMGAQPLAYFKAVIDEELARLR